MIVHRTVDGVEVSDWRFARDDDGKVTIHVRPQAGGPVLAMESTVWAQVVAAMSVTGDAAYHQALGLHQGEPL